MARLSRHDEMQRNTADITIVYAIPFLSFSFFLFYFTFFHMRSSFLLLSAAVLATSSVYCSPIDSSTTNNHDEPKLVRLPLIRRPHSGNIDPGSLRKRDPFSATLYNDQGSQYLVEVGVGTPAQQFTVTFDTGR